jgi:hypothetical protein
MRPCRLESPASLPDTPLWQIDWLPTDSGQRFFHALQEDADKAMTMVRFLAGSPL